ncbi:MAG: hypothetical protein K0S32_3205 [Bacteroidetes bacterium]|jgi:type IX secretion system PorP/SprF family membrane protein|nr:hypothetical protein [Bacteroidota bacterium]
MKFNLLIILLVFSISLFSQHRSDYIQYIFNGFFFNPACAGSREALNMSAHYRKQWIGIEGAPETISFGIDAPIRSKKVNLGFLAMNDQYGVFNHTRASLAYAYRLRLINGYLSFGLQAGFDTYTSNQSKLHTIEVNDPSFNSVIQRNTVLNAGAGTFYYSKRFFIGASAPDLLNGYFDKYRSLLFHTGYLADITSTLKFKPAVFVKYIFNSPVAANVSGSFYWKDIIGVGAGYTLNTSLIAFLDLRLNDQFRFGYGYDHTLTKLNTYCIGSHEVLLRYLFRYKVESLSTRYF